MTYTPRTGFAAELINRLQGGSIPPRGAICSGFNSPCGVQVNAVHHQREQPQEHPEPTPRGPAGRSREQTETGECEADQGGDLEQQGNNVHGHLHQDKRPQGLDVPNSRRHSIRKRSRSPTPAVMRASCRSRRASARSSSVTLPSPSLPAARRWRRSAGPSSRWRLGLPEAVLRRSQGP
jgi:hypothetical protein